MTVTLPRPVPDPSGGEAASGDHNSCGRRMTQAIIRTTCDPSPLLIPDGAWAAGHYVGNQWVHGIADSVNAFGEGWHAEAVWPADVVADLIAAIAAGHYFGVSIWCDGNANPTVGPVGSNPPSHWVGAFSDAADVFNCWLQTFPRYAQLRSYYDSRVGCVRIWHDPSLAATDIPRPPAIALSTASAGDAHMVRDCIRPDGSGFVDSIHLTPDGVARHVAKDNAGVFRYGPDPLPGRYSSIDVWGWHNGKLTFHGLAVDLLGNSGYFATEKTGDKLGGWLTPGVRQGGSGPPTA